jgi:hypothetical protein
VAAKTTPAYQNSFGKSHLVTVVAIFALTAVLGGMYVGLHLLPGEIAETVAQNLRYIPPGRPRWRCRHLVLVAATPKAPH